MEIIFKILVGIAGSYFTYYIISLGIKRAVSKETNGRLHFGGFFLGLTIICTIFTTFMIWVLFFVDHGGQEIPIYCLIAMFGLPSIYCWAELIWTKGFFNDEGIGFQTLWFGRRYYEWPQLIDVSFNEYLYWYVLRFENGKPIRISVYLHGHGELLDKLEGI